MEEPDVNPTEDPKLCVIGNRGLTGGLSLVAAVPTMREERSGHKEAHLGLCPPRRLTALIDVLTQEVACRGPDAAQLCW